MIVVPEALPHSDNHRLLAHHLGDPQSTGQIQAEHLDKVVADLCGIVVNALMRLGVEKLFSRSLQLHISGLIVITVHMNHVD